MDQYLSWLVQAEQQYQQPWAPWVLAISRWLLRVSLVVAARSMFLVRDGVVLAMNMVYMMALIPLDVCLCVIYMVAMNVAPDDGDDDYRQHDDRGEAVNLNIIRRLFWQGKTVAVTSDFKGLTLPKSIMLDEIVLDASDGQARLWQKSSTQQQQQQQQQQQPKQLQLSRAQEPFEQDIVLDEEQQQQVTVRHAHTKAMQRPTLRGKMHLMKRSGDAKRSGQLRRHWYSRRHKPRRYRSQQRPLQKF